MEYFLQNYGTLIIQATLRYFIIAGIAFCLFYVLFSSVFMKNKIQYNKAKTSAFRFEIINSMLMTLVVGVFVSLLLFTSIKNYTLIYVDMDMYPQWWFVLSIGIGLIIHDTYFYWAHRMMHHPKLFKYFHLTHHKSVNPSPWTSYSFGFLECIIESFIVVILAFILPMHPYAILLFSIISFAINVYGHLGYEIMPKRFRNSILFQVINTSVHHNMHHKYFKGNYGLYFRFWDRIMGTENPSYVSNYDKIQEQRFPLK